MSVTQKVLVIAGPTASGKSGLAVSVAQAAGGVVINADSLQIYEDLPLLTAQPDAAERAAAPHFLYGFAAPGDRYSAARWRDAAQEAVTAAHAAGQLPVVVGGTGFYIDALLRGLSPIPAVPPAARAQAQAFCDSQGTAALYDLLCAEDPQAQALDAHNPQRLVRAYEVLLHTGKPISWWQQQPRSGAPAGWDVTLVVLAPARETIRSRSDRRIRQMLDSGLIEEVAGFARKIEQGQAPADAPLTHACGYAPLAAHVAGDMTLEAALELMRIDTHQYAKRQQTWFRNQMPHALRQEAPDASALLALLRA